MDDKKPEDKWTPNPMLALSAGDVLIFILVASATIWISTSFQTKIIPYSQFLQEVKSPNTFKELVISEQEIAGTYAAGPMKDKRFVTYRVDPLLSDKLAATNNLFYGAAPDNKFLAFFGWLVVSLILFSLMGSVVRRGGAGGNPLGGFMSIEKNRARVYKQSSSKVTFADVAGVDEAKEELAEIVGFLKDPDSYKTLGGRLPKGILLVGPPGTGKTLLARAVAGETGVPFFAISGSEFVELFVGVGAARVRDLFVEARKNAPCIVFIDELDALGRARGSAAMPGAHDEKDQTLNQLLVELDGFDAGTGIILLAATNRPEILDGALLRAGRFDRTVLVDRPDKKGRIEVLNVHLKKVVISKDLNVEQIAALTPGFTGADLANLVNEAALLAARRKAAEVTSGDIENAIERIVAGLEKKSRLLSEKERLTVAYHEMGHAIVGMELPGTDKVKKVSIIPHGIAGLGFTVQRPDEDRYIVRRSELKNKLASMLGGRAAEFVMLGEISTGAADDLAKATDLARAMVVKYAMAPELGPVAYEPESGSANERWGLMSRTFSEQTAREIDFAIRELLDDAYNRAVSVVQKNRLWLERASDMLLQEETLDEQQLRQLKDEPAHCIVN